MRLVASAALACLVLLAIPAPATGRAEPAAAIDVPLEGQWRFTLGDDPAWSEPDFDDSAWEYRTVPTEGGQEDFDAVNSLAWFRRTFPLPADAAGADLFLALGVIDDADEVFVNGTQVAGSGVIGDEPKTAFFWPRLYDVAEAPFRPGQTNTIAIRVNDTGGGGGITTGPVAVLTRDRVAERVFGHSFTTADIATASDTMATQRAALAAGDTDAYLATLDAGFFHQGHDRDRQEARIRRLIDEHGTIDRRDEIVRGGVDPDGSLVVEVRRLWLAPDGTELPEAQGVASAPLEGPDRTLEFLRFDASTGNETGDRSRFFRDVVHSAVSDAPRQMNVYLPPSYLDGTDTRYPSVYLLHGAGGNNKEWEGKALARRLDRLIALGTIDEMIVIAVDGKSPASVNTWYANSSEEQWRTMFFDELLPQVDASFRTIDERSFRGTTGWSMGGQGAFTVAWERPDLFGSISSMSGALSFPPIVGSPVDLATNARLAPLVMVNTIDPLTLRSYCYALMAGEDDDFAFDDAARGMGAALAARTVLVTPEIVPSPAYHADHVQIPALTPAFMLHSKAFGTHDDTAGCEYRVPPPTGPEAVDDQVTSDDLVADPLGNLILDVVANDVDVDDDPLRIVGVVDADGEPFVDDVAPVVFDGGDGRLRIRPDAFQSPTRASAPLTGSYTVTDGRGGFATASFTIAAPPTPPAALPATDPVPSTPAPSTLPATGGAAPIAPALVVALAVGALATMALARRMRAATPAP